MSNENKEQIHMTVEATDNEVIIRHGQARPEVIAQRTALSGTITAPADWVEGKLAAGHTYFTDDCHVVVNRDKGAIVFRSNDQDAIEGGHTITGKLEEATALQELRINTNRTFTAKALGELLKMNRSLFADREENLKTVTDLQKFRATVTQELEKSDDLSGNKLYHFEQRVQSEFDMRFKLSTPIWKGQEPAKFTVEIRYDVTDGNVTYWLESVELKDLQDTQRDLIVDSQVDRLRQAGMPIIEQ